MIYSNASNHHFQLQESLQYFSTNDVHTNYLSLMTKSRSTGDSLSNNSPNDSLSTLTTLTNFTNNTVNNFNSNHDSNAATSTAASLPMDPFKFTQNQINCICETLLQSKKYDRLSQFICLLPPQMYEPTTSTSNFTHRNRPPSYQGSVAASPITSGNTLQTLHTREMLLRCKAHIAYASNNFNDLYELLQDNPFSSCLHSELQTLWNEAHYKESEIIRGRKLGAVDKYRIRRKFLLPRSIWDGDQLIYCFKEKARQALKDCYENNK